MITDNDKLNTQPPDWFDFQLITDAIPVFIAFVDGQQRYRFVNACYEQYYGLPREEIVGMTVKELNGAKEYARSREYIESALAGNEITFEYILPSQEKSLQETRYYVIKYIPRIEERVIGYYVVSTDITDIRYKEAKLQQTLGHIKALSDLAHRDRLINVGEMASSISHELTQPLMAISNSAHLLNSLLATPGWQPEKIKQMAQAITEQAIHAGDIIHRMRRFASKKTPRCEWVDIHEAISVAYKMLETRLDNWQTKVRFEFHDQPLEIQADSVQIQQVFVNLILNAAEAMQISQVQQPVINIKTASLPSGKVTATVNDIGPGVSESNQKKLFEPFESSKEDGMGLGLAISQSLLQSLQGDLRFDPDYREGASFIVTLPGREPTSICHENCCY